MYDPHTDIMNEVYLKHTSMLHEVRSVYAKRSDSNTPRKGNRVGASNSRVEGSHDDVWSSDRKYRYVEHAERNVLYKAAQEESLQLD